MITEGDEIVAKQYLDAVDETHNAFSVPKHRHVKNKHKEYHLVQQETLHEVIGENNAIDDEYSEIEKQFPDPLEIEQMDQCDRSSSTGDQVQAKYISAFSNLSVQYNLGVITPALLLLDPGEGKLDFIVY